MTEADLAGIPKWIQKSFEKVKEYSKLDKSKLLKVVWDSGASLSILNDPKDFVVPINEAHTAHLRGLAASVWNKGHVAWTFLDCQGTFRMLTLPAYYVPTAGMRLLSTPSLLRSTPNEFIHADKHTEESC
jgi:hypothetical protein